MKLVFNEVWRFQRVVAALILSAAFMLTCDFYHVTCHSFFSFFPSLYDCRMAVIKPE